MDFQRFLRSDASTYPKIAITRGLLFFFGFMLFYISISKINLAEATSLFFVSPFFMTIFSKLILKNYIGLNRIFSLLVGFSGTLLIIKPEFNNVNIYMLLPILCAFTYALSMTLAKKTSDKDNLFQQNLYFQGNHTVKHQRISIENITKSPLEPPGLSFGTSRELKNREKHKRFF